MNIRIVWIWQSMLRFMGLQRVGHDSEWTIPIVNMTERKHPCCQMDEQLLSKERTHNWGHASLRIVQTPLNKLDGLSSLLHSTGFLCSNGSCLTFVLETLPCRFHGTALSGFVLNLWRHSLSASFIGNWTFNKDPLKGKAAHSSMLAWRILWTVQSMGLQRVGNDWATFTLN